ncbi:hypothetical protein ABZ912_50105 [Nonomuraea angiospora]|uniref:hypothetical protein n=1 Tax=Nonomuraea angiospora TaxID=46172 RepID=UPI0033F1C3A7
MRSNPSSHRLDSGRPPGRPLALFDDDDPASGRAGFGRGGGEPLFGTFDDPFVLTPGDNEWTDCHRTAAGGYAPTERLDAVRTFL